MFNDQLEPAMQFYTAIFSEGISLFVDCEDQAKVDDYWDKLIHAGEKSMVSTPIS